MKYDYAKCPVCGMEVDRHLLELEYRGMHFAFCSEQCRERFETDPHLYVGYPGHRAPTAEGRESLKRRSLHLAEPLSDEMAARIRGVLMKMMGVKDISVHEDHVENTYDLLQATATQIEREMEKLGVALGEAWTDRLRRAFVRFSEETEAESLNDYSRSDGRHHGSCH